MKRIVAVFAALAALLLAASASAGGWSSSVTFTNQIASSPTPGGGYPDPDGTPAPGTCTTGNMNSNRSESWLAVKPGTEDLVGSSKFFFDKYSTFYNFYLGAYTIPSGTPASNTQIAGYECTTTGTQDMPPDWTNNTDPNVDFDSKGRAYEITLPFNAYWTNLHPNGAIGAVYSDDLGRTWRKGNQGQYLDFFSNSSSFSFGDVVDKQWIAVNHGVAAPYKNPNLDHVYAFWSVFNGDSVLIKFARSTDRGQHFSAPASITPPNQVGPSTTYIYPSIDAKGTLYAAVASFPASSGSSYATLYVTHSDDDGTTWAPWSSTNQVSHGTTGCCLPNTTFRDGILESFAASPTYPGHLYLAYEQWDGTQMDVMFTQSTNGGTTWSAPVVANDNVDGSTSTDQFQPSVAAGSGGAVAVAFYDRRQACPVDKSVLAADQGRTNFCIDTTLQAYKDSGGGAAAVGSNVRISQYTWDPQNPGQHVDGIGQMACASHRDPCTTRSFIGDYFGLAVSDANVYGLFVSTHYPSGVKADEGGRVYYQQEILSTVPRSGLGF